MNKTLSCYTFFIFCFFLQGCISDHKEQKVSSQEIKGRGFAAKKSIYRVKAPDTWIRRDPLPNEDLKDTTKAIAEFIINDGDELIRIAIHSFPSDNFEERIPSEAQIARWKKQFTNLTPSDYSLTPYSANGYLGLIFNASGMQEKKPIKMIALSLLLAPIHYQTLMHSDDPAILEKQKEMRADITIKAVGHPKTFIHHEDAIMQFLRSFELIDEIPTRS